MTEGAFALLDCLGFKGFWKTASPDHIIEKLETAKARADRLMQQGPQRWHQDRGLRTEISFLSDTIVIAAYLPPDFTHTDVTRGALVETAAMLACHLAAEFLEGPHPRALRGCITYGEFVIHQTFILGKAVDEAATLEKEPNGAFIWISPTAEPYYRVHRQELMQRELPVTIDAMVAVRTFIGGPEQGAALSRALNEQLPPHLTKQLLEQYAVMQNSKTYKQSTSPTLDYRMPLKRGDRIACLVVNFCRAWEGLDYPTLFSQIDQAMNSADLDVIIKKQNTRVFIAAGIDQIAPALQLTLALAEKVGALLGEHARAITNKALGKTSNT